MPETPPFNFEQADILEDLRFEIQLVKQEHEAALEEHQRALLECQHEIASLRQLTSELRQHVTNRFPSSSAASIATLGSVNNSSAVKAVDHGVAFSGEEGPTPEYSRKIEAGPSKKQDFCNEQSLRLNSEQFYAYEHLPEHGSIRLLKLSKGSVFDPLEFKLVFSRPTGVTPYHALSYTWGETAKTHHISIDGKRLPIAANLDRALRKIRRSGRTAHLWVDAVCINQDDIIEKAQQISLMLQIYKSAQKVIIYLGDQSDHSELLPAYFDTMIRGYRGLRHAKTDRGYSGEQEDTKRVVRTLNLAKPSDWGKKDTQIWHAARAFFDRPWFFRAWVVQEMVAARELTIMCGGWELPGIKVETPVVASKQYKILSPFVDSNEGRGHSQFFRMALARGAGLAERTEDFLSLVTYGHESKATDPRDQVYSLLGMAREAEEAALRPDYEEDWRDTYLRYTAFLFRRGQGLRVLYLSSSGWASRHKQSGDLPSWVPDFSFKGDRPYLVHENSEPNGKSAAGGSDDPMMNMNLTLKTLSIQVLRVDSLLSLSPVRVLRKTSDGDGYGQIVEWRTELEELWGTSQRPYSRCMQDTICRVMLRRQEPSDPESLSAAVWSPTGAGHDEQVRRRRKLRERIYNDGRLQRGCLTSAGRLGQVPFYAQEGDVIVVPIGSMVPFVLRRWHAGYKLIGQAYVDGIMMGEAFDLGFAREEVDLF